MSKKQIKKGNDCNESIIYYGYGEKETVNSLSYELANEVGEITGYGLMGSEAVDGAGIKDWAIDELEIPSITIEIGCQESPLAERECYSVFVKNVMSLRYS